MLSTVFLDRDGTLIGHVHYLAHPSQVELMPGCAEALRRLREAGFSLVIATNQAGLEKGYISSDNLDAVHQRMLDLLAAQGVVIDAIQVSPQAQQGPDRSRIEHPDRKPGPGMLLRAARELNADLARSYMLGDRFSDVLAGYNAGCRANLLLTAQITPAPGDEAANCIRVRDLTQAADWILSDAAGTDGD